MSIISKFIQGLKKNNSDYTNSSNKRDMKFDSDLKMFNEEMIQARKSLRENLYNLTGAVYVPRDMNIDSASFDKITNRRIFFAGPTYQVPTYQVLGPTIASILAQDLFNVSWAKNIDPNSGLPGMLENRLAAVETGPAVFYANVNTHADNAVFSAFGIEGSKNIPSLEAWLSGKTLTKDPYPYLFEISDKDKLTLLGELADIHDKKFERIRNTFVDDVQKLAVVLLRSLSGQPYEPEYGSTLQTALVAFLKEVESQFSSFVSSKNALLKNYKETDKNYVQEMKTLLLHTIIKLVSGFQTGFTTAYTEFKKDTDNFSPNSLVNADFILAHNTYINIITLGKNLILTQIDDIITGMKAIYSVYDPTEIAAILTDASAKIKELFAVASKSNNFTADATKIVDVLNKNYTDGMAYCSLVSSSCMSLLYEGEKKEGEKVKEGEKKEVEVKEVEVKEVEVKEVEVK